MRIGRLDSLASRQVVQAARPFRSPRQSRVGALRLLATLLLAAGILAPFAQVAAATPRALPLAAVPATAAQRDGAPPPIPEPTRVVATGSFQGELGCPTDNDPTCIVSELPDDGGVWEASFLLPAGQYTYRAFVETPEGDFSLGENGDPDGDDITFSVQGTGGGAYFVYDTHLGEVSATPFTAQYVLGIEQLGDYTLRPIADNRYEVYLTAPAGQFPYDVLANGEVVGSGEAINLDVQARVHIVVDANGQTLVKETVETAAVTIVKVDETGAALEGSCFALYEGQNTLANQACDGDDGAEDGQTLLFFPNGVEPGQFELVETLVPDGQPAAEERNVQVSVGTQTVQVQVEATAGETPTTEAGNSDSIRTGGETPTADATRTIRDSDGDATETDTPSDGLTLELESRDRASGETVPGACFQVDTQTGEVCDEDDGDEDGFVNLEGVEPGSYTVTETRPPDGYLTVGTFPLDVFAGGGVEYFIPHDVDPAAQPTTAATETPEVSATATTSGQTIRDSQTGSLVIEAVDASTGEPIAGACFTITDAATGDQAEVCDADDGTNDGSTMFLDLPAGDHTLAVSVAPEGYSGFDDRTAPISITTGQTATGTIQFEPDAAITETPTVTPEGGRIQSSNETPTAGTGSETLRLEAEDQNRNTVTGACYALDGGDEVCDADDGDEDGFVTFPGVEADTYQVTETKAPDGYVRIQNAFPIEVSAGANNDFYIQHQVDPNASATAEATATTTVTTTTMATTTPTVTAAAETGDVVVLKTDENGDPLGGSCFELVNPADQSVVADEVCDADGDLAGDGRIGFFDVPAGDYLLRETTTPDGYQTSTDQTVTVEDGSVQVTSQAEPEEPETGSLIIQRADERGGRLGGACIQLTADDGGAITGPICDNGTDDADPAGATILINDLAAGTYSLSETTTPDGVEAPAEQDVEITAGESTRVTIQTDDSEPPFGTLRVVFEDEDGNPATGACVNVSNDAGDFGPFCDDQFDGVNDGVTVIPQVESGENTITLVTTPAGYEAVADDTSQTVTVTGGEETDVTIGFSRSTGSVQILVTDNETGNPIVGTCYTLTGPLTYGPVCDNGGAASAAFFANPAAFGLQQEVQDADPAVGVILIEDVVTGDYILTQTQAPEGVEPFGEAALTVQEDQISEVEVQNVPEAPETGTVEITSLDEAGDSLAGACFGLVGGAGSGDVEPVCDGDDQDGSPDDGVVTLADVQPGTYTLTETRAPDGYVAVADQSVTVTAAETASVEVQHETTPPETGSIVVTATGPDGATVGGACYSLGGPSLEICDNDGNDANPDAGVIRFDDLEAGEITVTETQAPNGLDLADPPSQTVTVGGGDVVEITFTHEVAEAETGGVRVIAETPDGEPIEGACFSLVSGGQEFGPVCDNDPGDGDDVIGNILFADVPTGNYQVIQQGAADGFQAAEARSVAVEAGVTVQVLILIIIDEPDSADLLVTKWDEGGRLLGGSCFALVSGGEQIEICDGDANDGDGTTGEIRFSNIPTGAYDLVETQAPDGYQEAGDRRVSISPAGDGLVRIVVRNVPVADATGDVVVLKTDENGDPLGGACFALLNGAIEVARACDEDGDVAGDGRIGILGVPAGTYTLREVRRPSTDYVRASDRTIEVAPGSAIEVPVRNQLRAATLVVEKVDETGAALNGACFALDGAIRYERCDSDDSAGDDGTLTFQGIVPGDYTLIETLIPAGYDGAGDQSVALAPGQRLVLTVENTPLPPPVAAGDLVLSKVDQTGAPLAGACFSLRDGDRTVAGPRCDGADGIAEGTLTFSGVAAGSYTLHETRVPAAIYQRADDREVTIDAGGTTNVTVENALKPGRVLVQKVSQQGHLLQGACFDLAPDGQPSQCTDGSGTVVFSGLEPGTYRLEETQAPAGYIAADAIEGIIVNPGATTVLTVENELAPPPPNTGTLQIRKFYCTAAPGGEGTVFFDSSDSGPSQLAETANCNDDIAGFSLSALDSGANDITFSTNEDGAYQTTLRSGTYVLTETSPDLAGDARETVVIGTNQLTTVVVLNYVEPPPPAPVSIAVVKYTCEPAFAGTIYADFVDNCTADAQRTNDVGFRITGPVAARGTTGSGGVAGAVTFDDLPVGTYTLTEDLFDFNSTVYSFCGVDPNAPVIKSVGATTTLLLEGGNAVTCTYFNVPDDLTDTTGAILVHKLVCPVETPPAGYDFETLCSPQSIPARFSLSQYSAETRDYVPLTTDATNADGLLRVSRVQPGRYQLTEIGDVWCYAESNSVDQNGDLIVEAGKRTEVFIYNCSPVEEQPNTGSGSMASVQAPGGALGSVGPLLSLGWPLAALAAAVWFRRIRARIS